MSDAKADALRFLAGGGEMGALIREKDWSKTPVGSPERWPQSLLSPLSIVLSSRFPMLLFWGEELTCFYNDAYRPSLGKDGKHPAILGMAAAEAWPEIWDIIKPLIDQVLGGGGATWSEDQLIPIYRNGHLEDVYWTFSYAPVLDEAAEIAGVLVTCTETTEKVRTFEKLEESREQLLFAIEAAELGTFDYNPLTNKFLANDRLRQWFGLSSDEQLNLDLALNVIVEEDRAKAIVAIENALDYENGGNYDIVYTIQHPETKQRKIVHAKGRVWFNMQKVAFRLNGTLEDITECAKAMISIEQNNEKLNVIIEASKLGVYELNLQTSEVKYSDRYLEIFGYEAGRKFTHAELRSHIHPADVLKRDAAVENALKQGFIHLQSRIVWADGSVHWIESREKVFYENAVPITLIGTIRDITEEKIRLEDQRAFANELECQIKERAHELVRLNDVLKKSDERYHLMVEEVQDYAMYYLNREGIIENWNAGAEKIKGYTSEEVVGKRFSIFYTESDRNSNLPDKLLDQAVTKGCAVQEGWRVRKDGSHFWANVVITSVHNDKREVIGFSKVTHDLSEKKKVEDNLKRNAAELEIAISNLRKMNSELESFAYMSSHDLQEPLRKIQTFADRIVEREQNLSDEGRDMFRRMQTAADRMQLLIDDLLAYSRTTNADRKFLKTDLNRIVDEVKLELKEELQQRQALLEVDMCDVAIIPFQFKQMLLNLVGNSLKFTKESQAPHIIINSKIVKGESIALEGIQKGEDYCHLSIADNGIGFDQKYSERIFELFQRLHGRTEYNGTGIGLAIVKKIVDNHNGKITTKSVPGEGAQFDIFIPANLETSKNAVLAA